THPAQVTVALPKRLDERSLLLVRQTLHPVGHALFCGAMSEEGLEQSPERQRVGNDFRRVPPAAHLRRQAETGENSLETLDVLALLLVEAEELLVWLAGRAGYRAFGEVVTGERHEVVIDRDLAEAFGGERCPVFLLLRASELGQSRRPSRSVWVPAA